MGKRAAAALEPQVTAQDIGSEDRGAAGLAGHRQHGAPFRGVTLAGVTGYDIVWLEDQDGRTHLLRAEHNPDGTSSWACPEGVTSAKVSHIRLPGDREPCDMGHGLRACCSTRQLGPHAGDCPKPDSFQAGMLDHEAMFRHETEVR
jgi:hypothetical protein